jgi:hypothetical protein
MATEATELDQHQTTVSVVAHKEEGAPMSIEPAAAEPRSEVRLAPPTVDADEPVVQAQDPSPTTSSYLDTVKRFIPDPSRPITVFQPKSRVTPSSLSSPSQQQQQPEVSNNSHQNDLVPSAGVTDDGNGEPSMMVAPPPASWSYVAPSSFPTSPGKQTFDTQSSVTHHDTESVVSSWVDDDDYFVSAAMQDVRIVHQVGSSTPVPVVGQQQPRRREQGRRGGAAGGWKETGHSRRRPDPSSQYGPQQQQQQQYPQQQQQPQQRPGNHTATGKSPVTSVSGGRFDALATDKRRW